MAEKFSTAPHTEPDHTRKKRKNSLWCPYCGKWQVFKRNKFGTKSCPVCVISDNDFWVRNVNKTWGFSVKPRGCRGVLDE